MADSSIGLERSIDPITYSPPTSSPSIASLVQQATIRQSMGQDTEAEELLRQALGIADRTLGPGDPELMLLLTDLTRLHLRRSSYAAAEPLLLRLLELKRGKGDDHPEVATVLANLANVRQALGHHESAEQLWRRVLEIRERTLAPNHFAIATALEHLGDSCAARGKIAEAFSVFQRALSIRERTLGSEHASLRVSREKIADLQLLASEDSLDIVAPGEPTLAPERYRLTSGDSAPLASQPPVFRERIPAPAPRKPQVVVHRPFGEDGAEDEPSGPANVVIPGMTSPQLVEAPSMAMASEAEPLPYRDALESLRDEMENPSSNTGLSERARELFNSGLASLGKKQVIVGGTAAVLGMLMIGVATGSHAFGEGEQGTALAAPVTEIPRATPAGTMVSSVTPSPAPSTVATDAASTSKAAAVTHPRPVEERPAPSKKVAEKKTESKSETRQIALPTVSSAVLSRLDSVATRTSAATHAGDAVVVAPANPFAGKRSTFSETEQSTSPVRARLIGDLPTPRVPSQVADVEGEVRVRFSVDATGAPVTSTIEVVASPNPLLTTAVRRVIPSMRFEPARTGGSDPKPIADVVQISFRFASTSR